MKNWFVFLLIQLLHTFGFAQEKHFHGLQHSKFVLQANAQYGTIVKHTQRFTAEVSEPSFQFELGASFRTFGSRPWERKLHYPEIGVSYIYTRYGNRDVFGEGHGLLPHIRFWITRGKIVDLYFRLGSGLAYITNPYNPVTNPTNNVIGSKINNITQLRFGNDFHVSPKTDLTLGFTFTHHSNARTQSPNLGTNIPAVSLGVRHTPFKDVNSYNTDTIPMPEKRNEYNYRFSMGITDRAIGGPKYPVYIQTFYYARHTSVANKVLLGATWATNMGKFDRILDSENPENQLYRASDLSLFVGDEIMLGKFGVFFLVGVYLFEPELNYAPIYAKLGVNYYFLDFGKNHQKLFVGANLKTHYSIAEYPELGVGITF
jgi:hypothetical protein